jgi:PAS domain S-box-containing protein
VAVLDACARRRTYTGVSLRPFVTEERAASPQWVRRLTLASRAAALVVAAIGAAVVFGWTAGVPWLEDPLDHFAPMAPNTALLLILCGLSLGLSVISVETAPRGPRRGRWAAHVLAVIAASLALTILAQDVVGRDFGVDRLLVAYAPRPAVPTTLGLLSAAIALLLLDVRPRRGFAPAELVATLVATLGWLALGAFLYGPSRFYRWSPYPHAGGMAIHSSIALIALGLGIAVARPESGATAVFVSRHVGGQVARRMLLVVLSVPVVGYFAVRAQDAGLYPPPGAAVVAGVGAMLATVVITVAISQSLDRTDARRRRVEAETREWKRFFDRATFGAAFSTDDGRLRLVNEGYARMHGYTVAELEGKRIAEIFPPNRRADFAEHVAVVLERGSCRWESEHLRKDGSVFPVVIDASAVRDEHGELLYRGAYVQDITREKEAEEARSRLASLVQSSDDAIVARALDGTVLHWNRGAERVYGYSAAEMVGSSLARIVPEDRRVESRAIRDRALAGNIVVGIETERLRKDGRRVPVAVTLSPIRDPAGNIVAISTIERDISVLKRLEREREEWASIVAHDLRQPAATIHMVAEMLARTEGEPAKQKAIHRIRRASDRLERMIGDLLDVSRIGAGHFSVKMTAVRLSSLVEEAIELSPEVADRCRVTVAPEVDRALVDEGRCVQVLSNLLSNAGKYGEPGVPVDVQVERAGDMAQLTVTNEGPGIAPDELPRLFARFARTRSAEAGAKPGLGLGLYICRGIVEAHGGKLWVESVPGEKTHFRFTLPLAPRVDAAACAPGPAPGVVHAP